MAACHSASKDSERQLSDYQILGRGAGKIYHGGHKRREDWDEQFHPRNREPKLSGSDGVGGIKLATIDASDEDLADYMITDWTIEQLHKTHGRPRSCPAGFMSHTLTREAALQT